MIFLHAAVLLNLCIVARCARNRKRNMAKHMTSEKVDDAAYGQPNVHTPDAVSRYGYLQVRIF